jgi:hypothetical protein
VEMRMLHFPSCTLSQISSITVLGRKWDGNSTMATSVSILKKTSSKASKYSTTTHQRGTKIVSILFRMRPISAC